MATFLVNIYSLLPIISTVSFHFLTTFPHPDSATSSQLFHSFPTPPVPSMLAKTFSFLQLFSDLFTNSSQLFHSFRGRSLYIKLFCPTIFNRLCKQVKFHIRYLRDYRQTRCYLDHQGPLHCNLVDDQTGNYWQEACSWQHNL